MKKPFFWTNLFLLIGFSASLSAQKVLELNKSRLDVGKRRFNITQVIDMRFDTRRLGVARVGMGNRKEEMVLSAPLPTAFQQYFNAKLPSEADLPNVVLRVSRLGLWEETTLIGSEGARIAADFEFFLQQGDRFAYLGDRKFRFTEGLGSDITKYHDDNLRAALQAAVDFLQDSVDWKTATALSANVTAGELVQRTVPKILTDQDLVIGAYKNFTDFRNNNPRLAVQIEEKNGESVLLIEGKKGKFRRAKPDDRIWGFCDGKNMYINQFGTFYQLNKMGENAFEFYGVDYDKKMSNTAIGAGAFGAIGGLIAGSMTKSRHYVVDWETGSFLQKEE